MILSSNGKFQREHCYFLFPFFKLGMGLAVIIDVIIFIFGLPDEAV